LVNAFCLALAARAAEILYYSAERIRRLVFNVLAASPGVTPMAAILIFSLALVAYR
jgi:hypothetical protein